MRLTLAVIFLAFAVLAAPVIWHFSATLLGDREALDATKSEIASVRETLAAQDERISALESRIADQSEQIAILLRDRVVRPEQPQQAPSPAPQVSALPYENVVQIGNRRNVNEGLTFASPDFLEEFLGLPREELSDECEEMTNEALVEMLELADVGPIRVKMLRPAILSLQQIFKNVEVYDRGLYDRIRSSGSLCVRRVRGSEDRASAHAYGLALDINIDGQLDTLGDGETQLGLTILAEFFRQEGWIWGAGFGREDSMHFEVSREKLEQWRRLGQI